MEITSVTSKGQVTIPKSLRQQLGLRQGSKVEFSLVGDHVELRVRSTPVEVPASGLLADPPAGATVILPFQPEPGWQVRIEQHMQIRITPRAQAPMRRDMFFDFPDDDFKVQYIEKKMGKCLSIAGIAGVQPDRGNRLLLYMRDRRLIGAELERSCRARDLYSGFYLSRTEDGQLCVDRDTLLSRSGMNCKLTRMRQLIEIGH